MFSKLKTLVRSQNDVVKHGAVYLTSRVGTKILGFLMLPLWTMLLTPSEYGVIGLVLAYAGMGVPLLLFGIPSAIVRQYHDYKDTWSGYLKTIFSFIIGVLVLIYFSLELWHWVCGDEAPAMVVHYRYVFCLSLVGGALTQIAVAGLQAERSSRQFIVGNFVSYLSGLVLSLVLVIGLKLGPKGFLYGMSLGCVVGVSYIVWSRRKTWCIRSEKVKKEYIAVGVRYGYALVPAAVAGWGVNFSSRLVVEKYHSLHEVGLFSFAGNIALIVSFVMISLSQAWVPTYYAARKKGGRQEITKSHFQIEKIILYVGG